MYRVVSILFGVIRMSKMNTKSVYKEKTAGGSSAHPISLKEQLDRTLMSCMLFEKGFYEDGQSIADRLKYLANTCKPEDVICAAIKARTVGNLRHAPLFIMAHLCNRVIQMNDAAMKVVIDITVPIAEVIQRVDDMAEFVLMFWEARGKQNLPRQVKLGLAKAMNKFDEYGYAKYNRSGVRLPLKNILRMVHPIPKNKEQSEIFRKLRHDELDTPDTWEVALSGGADKNEAFTRLLKEQKLPYMALLRNLRNMKNANVDKSLIHKALTSGNASRVLPFRFLAAAREVPGWEDMIEEAFFNRMGMGPKLSGRTVIIVDISGSMASSLSSNSSMSREDASNMLVAILREMCDDCVIYATGGNDYSRKHATGVVSHRRGFALCDAILSTRKTLGAGGIFLKQVTDYVYERESDIDRVIVITDEQDTSGDNSPNLVKFVCDKNYLINVATDENGIGYGKWTHINGFSAQAADFIHEYERNQ